MTITLDFCNKTRIHEIVQFTIDHYGKDFFTNIDYYLWRFFNPLSPDSFLLCAYADNLLIGTTGVSINNYSFNGDKIKVGVIICALVLPTYRHYLIRHNKSLTTIFGALVAKAEEESSLKKCDFLLAFPNSNSFPHFIDNFGFSNPGYLDFLFYPVNFNAIFNQFRIPTFLGQIGGHISNIIYHKLKARRLADKSITIQHNIADKDIEQLWRRCSVSNNFLLLRDKNYFSWRIADSFNFGYQYCGAYIDNTLKGIIVWKTGDTKDRVNQSNYFCTKIVDFWIVPDVFEESTTIALANELISIAQKQNSLFILSTIKTSSVMSSHFKKSGFILFRNKMLDKKIPIVIKAISARIDIPNISQFYLTMADNDIV
jgi:hypothetical protein